jgi:ADP-heptose:LPS heptosyltransferase
MDGVARIGGMESVLVNFVYAQQIGHAIEALHYANGYHAAGPSRRIGVVLNANTPAELADWCPFVDEVHTIDLDLFDPATDARDQLAKIAPDWDYVVNDYRSTQAAQREIFPGLAAYYDQANAYFTGTKGFAGFKLPPAYALRQPLRLDLPQTERHGFAVLLGGSADRHMYPTVASWRLVLTELAERFPGTEIRLLGRLAKDGRTSTTYRREEYEQLAATVPGARLALDLPLRDQLCLVGASKVFLSPHTGFGMVALATGTPWLCLSGNRWPEFWFNEGVPFYSVLPDRARFPSYTALGPEPQPVEDEGPRTPSMSAARIRADLPELLDAATLLHDGELDFPTALAGHRDRLDRCWGGDRSMMYSIDNVLAVS